MVIRINRRSVFKPRVCPDCGRICLLARHELALRCRDCSKKKHHHLHHQRTRKKYNGAYRKARQRLIEAHPYCSLCGAEENLTAHHVGGGADNSKLTILCEKCHQAYEAWAQRERIRGRHEQSLLWHILRTSDKQKELQNAVQTT